MSAASDVEVLFEPPRLAARVAELGAQITRDYADKELVVVCVLKGSFIFAADLLRRIELPLTVDFLALQSYGHAQVSSGVVQILNDLSQSVEGRDVLIVEDIVDTGLTVEYLRQNLTTRRPRSVRLCALLHKPARARVESKIDYLGFTIDDVFVVGYGLDYAQRYRNLPFLGVVRTGATGAP